MMHVATGTRAVTGDACCAEKVRVRRATFSAHSRPALDPARRFPRLPATPAATDRPNPLHRARSRVHAGSILFAALHPPRNILSAFQPSCIQPSWLVRSFCPPSLWLPLSLQSTYSATLAELKRSKLNIIPLIYRALFSSIVLIYLTLAFPLFQNQLGGCTMSGWLDQFECLDIIGNGSFGVIRKVRRKADNQVRPPSSVTLL